MELEHDSEGRTPDLGELHLPVFVLFAAGELWAYSDARQLDLSLRALTADDLQAWDSTGRRLRLSGEEGSRLLVVDPDTDDRVGLQSLLLARLRERHVAGVDTLSFDELVDKGSIRFTTSPIIEAPWWMRLIGAVLSFGQAPSS